MPHALNGQVLGFDPGGSSRNGNAVAILEVNSGRATAVRCGHFESVDAAEAWIRDETTPRGWLGLGIDTLLAWSGRRSGWRVADRSLRHAYPAVEQSVVAPNGLYGSMCLGGPLLAARLRSSKQSLPLFETHPKVLFYALTEREYDWDGHSAEMLDFIHQLLPADPGEQYAEVNEDEFDAILSAAVALKALLGRWTFNLYSLSERCDEPLFYPVPGARAVYPWPRRIAVDCADRD